MIAISIVILIVIIVARSQFAIRNSQFVVIVALIAIIAVLIVILIAMLIVILIVMIVIWCEALSFDFWSWPTKGGSEGGC